MLKQSPSRNQRSRGFKVKHAIQICLLISICVWLLYQVIHLYDNHKSREESSAKISLKLQPSGRGTIKLGRKDIYGERVDETEEGKAEEEGRGVRDEDVDQEEAEEVEDLIDVEDGENEDKSNNVAYKGLLEEEHYDLQSKSFGSSG